MIIRLDRLLSSMGKGTRREVSDAVKSGRVVVGSCVCRVPDIKVDTEKCTVYFDGTQVKYKEFVYYMMNKPAGYLSATSDPREKTVLDLISPEDCRRGLFPAGRLDKDSEGLLIITNDGDAAHMLLSPRRHVAKLYRVEYEGILRTDAGALFTDGIELSDGEKCKPAVLELTGEGQALVTVSEGKFHQVKRMIEAVGGSVKHLKRLKMGELCLDLSLKGGEYRPLSETEEKYVKSLKTENVIKLTKDGSKN